MDTLTTIYLITFTFDHPFDNLCRNGYARLWMIRNLKKNGAGREDLLDVYGKQCRSVMELAVPVWNAGISVAEANQLERVQKSAFAIILGKSYSSYRSALAELKMETLKNRRSQISLSFARKARNNDKFKNRFKISDQPDEPTFTPVPFRTKRYKNSPFPYLSDLLNAV